jgi:hypothetical protein
VIARSLFGLSAFAAKLPIGARKRRGYKVLSQQLARAPLLSPRQLKQQDWRELGVPQTLEQPPDVHIRPKGIRESLHLIW